MTVNRRSALKLLGSGLFGSQFAGAVGRTTPGGLYFDAPLAAKAALGYSLTEVAQQAGIHFNQVCGGDAGKKYILETTGSGVAFIDYDNDGWQDIFLVSGSRLAGFPAGQEPTNRLFHNNRDGTFTDVTVRAGVNRTGWGQGVCIGDYDNDGYEDIFVTYWGEDVLYHNYQSARY